MTLLCPSPEVAEALAGGRPVVALESTLISHGLPWPINLETARAAEQAVREAGAVPATIAVLAGVPRIGLSPGELELLARGKDVLKASRRDLGIAVAHKLTAGTTVAGTMFLAQRAGIRLFATGGIGGAHRGCAQTGDVSADLEELARTPVCVVCAGAKSVLDLPMTLEMLETRGVPVLGFGTEEFPAFYLRTSGLPVTSRIDDPATAAQVLLAHWSLGGAGVVLAQPLPEEVALGAAEWENALALAERDLAESGVRGKEVTPFLLRRLAEITGGRSLRANQTLIVANARLAAQVAGQLPPI